MGGVQTWEAVTTALRTVVRAWASKGAIPDGRARVSEYGNPGAQTKRRTGRKTNFSTQNVCNAHLVIVDHVCEMVGRQAVRFPQDEIFDWQRLVRDRVIYDVFLYQSLRRTLDKNESESKTGGGLEENKIARADGRKTDLEPDDTLFSPTEAFLHLGLVQSKTLAVVRAPLLTLLLQQLPRLREPIGTAKAMVRFAGLHARSFRVNRMMVRER